MSTTTEVETAASHGGGGLHRPARLIAVLAVTQTIGYGVLFYAFSVLLGPMAHDLGTSTATVTGAFTTAIITAAAAAIPIGRWLDRHGGRLLMAGGSVLAVTAVTAWSQVRDVQQLYAVFILIGLASAMVLYEAAFPVVVAVVDPGRRDNALLAVTVVAGFASSVFFPVTGLLLDRVGWRSTLLVLAAVLAAVTVPAHALMVPGRSRHRAATARRGGIRVREALRDRGFWLLAVAFVAHSAAVSAIAVHLVGYLRHAGHTTAVAATLAGLLGVLSVTGRLLTTRMSKRYTMPAVTAAVFALQSAAAAAMPHLSHTVAGAAACVIAFGLGFGVATIARPAILADRYGTTRYATIAAAMALPITLAKAAAPWAAAFMAANAFVNACATACLTAAILLAWSVRSRR